MVTGGGCRTAGPTGKDILTSNKNDMDIPQLNDYAIDIAAKGYGRQMDKEIAEVNLEHAKWFRKHPEERPNQWNGIKACGMFMRTAFADGARWYREEQ